MAGIEKQFAAVHTPILAANALDDLWAMPGSRDAFLEGYSQAPITRLDLAPDRQGGQIGHMGYFRASAEPLWQDALEWLTGLPPPPAQA